MRTRFLFAALISFLSVNCASAKMTSEKITPQKEFIKKQLDNKISQLVLDAKSQKSKDSVWKGLSKMEADITALRKENPRQKEDEEIYIETVTLLLKDIPRRQDFKREKCDQYRTNILAQYDPQHETHPSPAVSKGLEVLDIFCK